MKKPTKTLKFTRAAFKETASRFCDHLRGEMLVKLLAAFDAFTEDELATYAEAAHGGERPDCLVRVLGMAVGNQVIADRFDVEAIKTVVPRAKRVLSKRSFR